jgi:hypothetical protein
MSSMNKVEVDKDDGGHCKQGKGRIGGVSVSSHLPLPIVLVLLLVVIGGGGQGDGGGGVVGEGWRVGWSNKDMISRFNPLHYILS